MPEGDTVLAAANRLHQVLAGQTLARADLNWPTAPPDIFRNRVVREVGAYGKHMLMRFDNDLSLHTHLKMDGVWRIVKNTDPGAKARGPFVRVALATEKWTCVGSRIGVLEVISTADETPVLAHLGPDVLADNFVPPVKIAAAIQDPKRFLAPRFSHAGLGMTEQGIGSSGWQRGLENFAAQPGSRPIAETLLDQTVVSGIGTIFMAEGLFKHGISPWRPVSEVKIEPLLFSIRNHLIRGVVVPTTGRIIHVHTRTSEPCHRCKNPIVRELVGPPLKERPAFYCPVCQSD